MNPLNPVYKPKVLDITDLKTKGDELKRDIIQGVKDTQRVIVQQLPNELLMTRQQYDMLQKDPEMKHAYTSDNHLYWTPDAVMEVRVKDMTIQGDFDTVEDKIDAVQDKLETAFKEDNDG